jgi:hypothetical protein
MPLLRRKSVLLAKIETTPGTDIEPTGTDGAFNVYDCVMQANIEMLERVGQGGAGRQSSVPGRRLATCTFRSYIEWDGTATEPSWMDTFWPACGWVKSTNTFNPTLEAVGTNVKTLTLYHYVDGVVKKMTGAAGNYTVTGVSGNLIEITWTFEGVWAGVSDASPPSPTYPTTSPLRWAGGVGQWNDVDLFANSFTINSGNTLTPIDSPTASGVVYMQISDRMPTVTIDPLAVTVAAQDRWGAWLAQTQHALEIDAGGPTTSVISFDVPKAQITNQQAGERGQLEIDELEFLCCKNGTTHNQELQIVLTPAA